jgi:hypothetical protein
MRTVLPSVGGVLFAVILTAGPIQAQEKDKEKEKAKDKEDMHRLVIYNGGARTVQYFGKEEGAARDRSRKENEASLADLAHDLRVLYLRNEMAMEIKRHQMQMLLYGYTTTYSYSWYPGGGYYSPYWGWDWGWGGYGDSARPGTTTYGLQFGSGDEGALKSQLIQGLGTPPAAEKAPPPPERKPQ